MAKGNTSATIQNLETKYLRTNRLSNNDLVMFLEQMADNFYKMAENSGKNDDLYWQFVNQSALLREASSTIMDMNILEYRELLAVETLKDIENSQSEAYTKLKIRNTLKELDEYKD